MKQNLGIMSPPSVACELTGCDPDFFLYSSVIVPPALALSTAFPGGSQGGGAGLWFFQNNLAKTLQSDVDFLTGSAPSSGARAGRLEVETMQVTHIGLQIMSTTGPNETIPEDLKQIAESALFEFWKDVNGDLTSPSVNRDADLEVPVVNLPSHVGVFGNTQSSGQGVASLGIPGLLMARQLEQPINLVRGELIAARISFPAQNITYVSSTGAVTPVAIPSAQLTTLVGVGVRLYLFGTGKYSR